MVVASETHMNAVPSSRIHEYIRAAGGRRDDYTMFDAGIYTVEFADYTAVARATMAGRWERLRAAGVQLRSGDAGRDGTHGCPSHDEAQTGSPHWLYFLYATKFRGELFRRRNEAAGTGAGEYGTTSGR